ncbi:YeeE/YedE thiosulfate transporter family protein [Gemmatimonadota bacterium]
MTGIFPLIFAVDEVRLLTAIGLGFMFGFSLERAGFGNARKLAGQFYFNDMTVFKVMFTAILVAMVGLRTFAAFGWLDMSRMWINPTFMWAQIIGGFLLGAGFIMSGLCPGTSVVSAASGRIDGVVTFGGIFVGSFLFAVMIDWFPGLAWLYTAGSMGDSILPQVLGAPTPVVVLAIVVMAGVAFVGAEKVEKHFQQRSEPVALTPVATRRTPRIKFAVAGALGVIAIVAIGATAPSLSAPPIEMEELSPLELAEAIIMGDPNLFVLDVRGEIPEGEGRIPGSYAVTPDSAALGLLGAAVPATKVIVYDHDGSMSLVPDSWPRRLEYRLVRGGFDGWEKDVLTPAEPTGYALAEREFILRQNQIAGYFSGAAVQSTVQAPPPAMGSGPKKKKKSMGC